MLRVCEWCVSAGVVCGNGQGFPEMRSCLTGWDFKVARGVV